MDEKVVLALIERVKLHGGAAEGKEILAKIDTGADNSSIDMELASELQLGPIVKTKRIISSHGKSLRPVVEVTMDLAGKTITEYFTLYNRSHMKFPVLIGKNILRQGFLIDPSLPDAIESDEMALVSAGKLTRQSSQLEDEMR